MTIQTKTKDMAYELLVLGKVPAIIAIKYNVTRQAVHKAGKRVFDKYLECIHCPDGWVHISICCPPGLAETIKEMHRKAVMDSSKK